MPLYDDHDVFSLTTWFKLRMMSMILVSVRKRFVRLVADDCMHT